MTGRLLLGGATDLTLAIADQVVEDVRVGLAAIVAPPAEFRISYSKEPVRNSRYADAPEWCRKRSIRFFPYTSSDDLVAAAAETGAIAALFAGWYHMVPRQVRAAFPRGCVGVHASLLPRYRGGAPLNWAMLNDEPEAGVSLFALDDGVDDGPLYDQRRFAIGPCDYIADVIAAAEAATLSMIGETLPGILDGSRRPQPQHGEPSYFPQRTPADGAIDWRRPAREIARLVRSVSRPYPGARAMLDGASVIIWRGRAVDGPLPAGAAPGQIVRAASQDAPAVATGDGLLIIEEMDGETYPLARAGA
jgi:methionyl-tRNA formyltransferase